MFSQILKSWTDHHLAKITKADKYFAKTFDFKDIYFQLRIRGIQKLEKKNSNFFDISVSGYESKKISSLCIRTITCGEENHVDLLLIGEGEKKNHVLTERFNRFMDDLGRRNCSC